MRVAERRSPVSVSQTKTCEPDSRLSAVTREPSGPNAGLATELVWPSSTWRHAPVVASQIRAVPSVTDAKNRLANRPRTNAASTNS